MEWFPCTVHCSSMKQKLWYHIWAGCSQRPSKFGVNSSGSRFLILHPWQLSAQQRLDQEDHLKTETVQVAKLFDVFLRCWLHLHTPQKDDRWDNDICIHMYIYTVYTVYTQWHAYAFCSFFLFGVDWNQEKKRASASSQTKTPSSCHHFSRYGRHDACSQLSVFANTELLRPEDRGQSVVLGCLFGKACSILFCLHDLICCSLTKPSTESTDCRSLEVRPRRSSDQSGPRRRQFQMMEFSSWRLKWNLLSWGQLHHSSSHYNLIIIIIIQSLGFAVWKL